MSSAYELWKLREEDARGFSLGDLMDRFAAEGPSRGLAYLMARSVWGHDYNVCVRCGWAWGGLNRCLNPECNGFCTWGAGLAAPPSSWLPTGPRPVGCPESVWRAAWRA